jgi:poly(A) polymerase
MKIALDQIDPDAVRVVKQLRRFGHAAYLVGGCVRDLLLGLRPKDFDVVTDATPNEIKRIFHNSRIIGRRFRLAHIFYGPKTIETATFRANPRELEDDDGDGAEAESGDLLIRRDNVFGTPEDDARRRDFTINGLFYDIETGQVIDHVSGMADLEARLVRTIGDPDIRFREDPIRILRAVKFAARCDLAIEPETYRRLLEHRGEIAKCAQARVSEEFYRLLRGGAAKRSMELLVETELLELLTPEIARGLKGEPADAEAALRRACGATWRASIARPPGARRPPRTRCCWRRCCSPRCATISIPTAAAWGTSDSWWRRPSRRRSSGCGRRDGTPSWRGRSCSRCATCCRRRTPTDGATVWTGASSPTTHGSWPRSSPTPNRST